MNPLPAMNPLVAAVIALVAKLVPQGLDLADLVAALADSDHIPQAERDAMKARIKRIADLDWS